MTKAPFSIRFKNDLIIIPRSFLMNSENEIEFSHRKRVEYLKIYHPNRLEEYMQHCEAFNQKFEMITAKIIAS